MSLCSHDTVVPVAKYPRLVAAGGHALLVVLGRLIVGVDDGVGSHTVSVVRIRPGVDGVDVIEHGHGEKSKHLGTNNCQTGLEANTCGCGKCECEPQPRENVMLRAYVCYV